MSPCSSDCIFRALTGLVWRAVSEDSGQLRARSNNRDREASFSVDVTRDVAIQPFLLIVRTRHVVTTVKRPVGRLTMSSAGFSEFPAFGQIYRQQWSTVSRRSEPSSRTALMGAGALRGVVSSTRGPRRTDRWCISRRANGVAD